MVIIEDIAPNSKEDVFIDVQINASEAVRC